MHVNTRQVGLGVLLATAGACTERVRVYRDKDTGPTSDGATTATGADAAPGADIVPTFDTETTATTADSEGAEVIEGADATDTETTATTPDAEGADVSTVDDVPDTFSADQCQQPGDPSTCPPSDVPGVSFYCRIDPSTASLTCQTSPAFASQYGTACATNDDCDVSLGCHFGVCTTYCKLGAGACPGQSHCAAIGHAVWGACEPNQ